MLKQFFPIFLIMLACAGLAQAQESWPSRPVKVMVGLAPGGATDIQARLFSQKLSEDLGRQFVVENRAGAGGLIAIQAGIAAPPDGYTVLVATPGLTLLPAFHEKPPFDPVRDLAPVSLITKAPYLVVVPASSPLKDIKELLALSRTLTGGLNFGTGGPGTAIHLGGMWIGNSINAPFTIVHYKGIGPALAALLTSEIHTTFANPITTLAQVKAGKLRVLAVTSAERSKVLSDIPTVAEAGIPGFDVTTWYGWLLPKSTPAPVVTRLHSALAKMIHSREMLDKLAPDAGEAVGSTPAQFAQMIASELLRWRKLVQDAGLKLE